MKTQKKAAHSPNTELQAYLTKSVVGDNGEILLTDILENVPTVDKHTIVAGLKHAEVGKFCIGRRGHPSRFQWGNVEPQPVIKARKPKNRLIESIASHMANLKINLGGMIHEVPIKLELVPLFA
jgi:hypothetical protein